MGNTITLTADRANTALPVEFQRPDTGAWVDGQLVAGTTNTYRAVLTGIPAGTYANILKARLKGSNPEVFYVFGGSVTVVDGSATPGTKATKPVFGTIDDVNNIVGLTSDYAYTEVVWGIETQSAQQLGSNSICSPGNIAGRLYAYVVANAAANRLQSDLAFSAPFTMAATPGNSDPTVTLSSPQSGQTLNVGDPVVLNANPQDANGAADIQRVEYLDNGVKFTETTAAPHTVQRALTTAGGHSFTARVYDMVGASGLSNAVPVTAQPVAGGPKKELLILGTSIEITTYAAAGKTLSDRLQALLGPDWVIRNYAVGGSTIRMKLDAARNPQVNPSGFYTPDPSCSEHYMISGGGINSEAGYNVPEGVKYGVPPLTSELIADEITLHQLAHNAGYVTLAITDSACGSEEGSVTQEVHDLNRLAYNQAVRSSLRDLAGLNTKYFVDWGLDANQGVFVKNGAPNPKHFLGDFLHPNDTVGIPYRAAIYAQAIQNMVAGLPVGQPVKVNTSGNGSAVTVAAPAYQKIAITNAKGITVDANGTLATTGTAAARTAISTLAFGVNAQGQRVGEVKFTVSGAGGSSYIGLTSSFPVSQPNAIQLPFHVIGGTGYRILGPFSGLDPSRNDNYTQNSGTHTYRLISTGTQVIFAVDNLQVFKLDYKLDTDVFPAFYLENGAVVESVQIGGDNLVQVAGVFVNPVGTRRIFDPSIAADTTGTFRIADQATKNFSTPDYFTLVNPTPGATPTPPRFVANAVNGLPAYEFTGTNFLQTDNTLGTPGAGPFAYHIVCRVPDGQVTSIMSFGGPVPDSQAAVADNTFESLWHIGKYTSLRTNMGVSAADEAGWCEVDVFSDGTTETITVNGQSVSYPAGAAGKPDPFLTLGASYYIGANNGTPRQIAWVEASDASAGQAAHVARRNALKTKFGLSY